MPARAFWIEPKKHRIVGSAKACALAVQMVPRTFADLVAAKVVAPREDGKFDTRMVSKALREHYAALDAMAERRASGAGGSKAQVSDALERQRGLRSDLLELELEAMRGRLVERDAVHAALGEVVAIHRSRLMGLPKLGAVELANQTPAQVEKWLDRWARGFGEEMQATWDRLPFLQAAPQSSPQAPIELVGPVAGTIDTNAKRRRTRKQVAKP